MVISIDKPITALCASPKKTGIVALGFIDGEIRCSKLIQPCTSTERLKNLWRKRLKSSVRGLEFSSDGKHLFSIGANYSLCVIDVENGKRIRCIVKSHDSKPSAIQKFNDEQIVRNQSLITGDEDGQVKTWDLNAMAPVISTYKEQEDRINSLSQYKALALASSSDGTLGTYDLRIGKLKLHSEVINGELTSIVTLEKHTYVGSSDGCIEVFNNGEFGNIFQRIETKQKFGVWSLIALRPNLLLAGSEFESQLNFIHVNPNKRLKSIDLDSGTDLLALDCSKKFLYVAGNGVDNMDEAKLHIFNLDDFLINIPILTAQSVKKLKKDGQNSIEFYKDLIEENGKDGEDETESSNSENEDQMEESSDEDDDI